MNHADYCGRFLSTKDVILDIGSGRGDFLCDMAQRGYMVHGIENNSNNVSIALDKAKEKGVVVHIKHGQAEHLPYADNSFDFVNCSEVTEHVVNPVMVCQEMHRVLKLNRYGYASFTNRFAFYDCHFHLFLINLMPRAWAEAILRLLKKNKEDSDSGRQTLLSMHYFTYSQAAELLKRCGFTFEDTRENKIKKYFGQSAQLLILFYRLFFRPISFSTFHFLVKKFQI